MQKFSAQVTVMLLTFGFGVAFAGVCMYQTYAKQSVKSPIEIIDYEPITTNQPTVNVAKNGTLEMVFVIDTTGSMGGLIEGAKQKVWSIVNDVMQKPSRPAVKIGLVAYRDKGDAYVTQVLPLTDDLDKVYSTLMQYSADGGGDTPENVRRALSETMKKAGWSQKSSDVAQIVFLVGDAPPQNYQEEPDVLTTTAEAVRKNMIINTIQCGSARDTTSIWQQIAQRGEGKYFAIAQDGGVTTISTPYDARLGELGNKIGQTYLAYGGGAGADGVNYRARKMTAQTATESSVASAAPMSAQADRALNKSINSRAYDGDLLQDIENNSTKLEAVKADDLPDDLKKLSPEARKKEIEKRLAERKKIRDEITELSKKRDAFIKAERAKAGKQDGFDSAVSTALQEQLKRKGIK